MLEEEIGTLTSLGLTQVQSKVFLALSKLRCAPVNRISEFSLVPRQDIYRVIGQLQELSLVQKVLTKPVRYQAISMEDACAILLNRKKEDFLNLRRKQKEFLRNFQDKKVSSSVDDFDYQFYVVKGKEAIFKNIQENFALCRERIDIATTQERFLQSLTHIGPLYLNKLREGVAIRVVTERPEDETSFLGHVKDYIGYSNFEIKFIRHTMKAIAILFDRKAAGAAMNPNEPLLKSPIVHTTNPAFLIMFSEYFDQVWKAGFEYDLLKNRVSS